MEILTVAEARSAISRDKRWKASVTEGESTPLYEDENARVRLFQTIGEASTYLKSRVDALKALDYEQSYGAIGRGTLVFERPEGKRYW